MHTNTRPVVESAPQPFQLLRHLAATTLDLLNQHLALVNQFFQILDRPVQHNGLASALILAQTRNHLRQPIKALANRLPAFLFLYSQRFVGGTETDRGDMVRSLLFA